MNKTIASNKIHSWLGIFFQVPVFLISAFGLYKLAEICFFSLTDFNPVGSLSFIGFKNYEKLFQNEITQKCFENTIVMVLSVTVLLLLTAVLPAIFTARLKLPFGLSIMGGFFTISICTALPGFFNTFFSNDAYGILNSQLLGAQVISEPITFVPLLAMPIAVLSLWLYCLAPIFSITYIAARKKHSFLGVAIAVCAIPILMYTGGNIVVGFAGFPSADYVVDWFYTLYYDYLNIRFDFGYASAILVTGLVMLAVWCLVICAATFGCWALFKKVRSNPSVLKTVGYITFGLSLLLCFTAWAVILIYLLRALMPMEEIFAFPSSLIPLRPTLQNFFNLIEFTSNTFTPFSQYLYNSLIAVPLLTVPFCLEVALPSGVGFGAFHAFKGQKLLLLCFIPFLFVSGWITLAYLKLTNSYFVYLFDFISSFEFLIAVFLVYLATRLVFCNGKPRVSGIVLGIFFVLSSFYAIGAINGIWSKCNIAIYSENLKNWMAFASDFSASDIARSGIAAANGICMLFATTAVLILPAALLLSLYLLYRKNTNNLIKEQEK